MAVTRSDVESLSSTGWTNLSDTKKDDLLDMARTEKDSIYSERVATLPTIDGDVDTFVTLLAAHKWELAEGGQAQSENSQGGSVNYQSPQGDIYQSLSQTRYGVEALAHLRDNQGIGIVRAGGRRT